MDTNWSGINRARMDLKSGKIPLETVTRFNAEDMIWRIGVDFATKPAAG